MDNGFSDDEITSALRVLDQLPDYYSWKTLDLRYAMMNQATAKLFGFVTSSISFDRITDHDLQCDASNLARHFQDDDYYVLNTGKDLTSLNFCQYQDDEWRLLFGRKSLILDNQTEKKGVFCRYIDVTTCPLFRMILGMFSKQQQQVSYVIKDSIDELNLSAREFEIVFHLLRGRSAKEIARITDLSVRTVEKHLDRIKNKMQCFSKSQLIDKLWSLGLQGYIPSAFFTKLA